MLCVSPYKGYISIRMNLIFFNEKCLKSANNANVNAPYSEKIYLYTQPKEAKMTTEFEKK